MSKIFNTIRPHLYSLPIALAVAGCSSGIDDMTGPAPGTPEQLIMGKWERVGARSGPGPTFQPYLDRCAYYLTIVVGSTGAYHVEDGVRGTTFAYELKKRDLPDDGIPYTFRLLDGRSPHGAIVTSDTLYLFQEESSGAVTVFVRR